MAIALRLSEYLAERGVRYELISHRHTDSSTNTAGAAHIPGRELAKAVVLHDSRGYVIAVLPASHHVDLSAVADVSGRALWLASEYELARLFPDCEQGAVPAIGQAYGYEVIVDDDLSTCPDIYVEAGDHEHVIHLDGTAFDGIMAGAAHGAISHAH